jgi:ATP-dependent helicase STH1/SNF2
MMHLRKVCNHPYLFPEVEEAFVGSQQFGDHLFRTCAKFELLDRLLPKVP